MEYKREVMPVIFNNNANNRFRAEIRFDDENGKLSICGICRYGAGQCQDQLMANYATPAKGFTQEMVCKLYHTWERWHLNDMRAGTLTQEAAVREWCGRGNTYDYDRVCNYLKSIGLLYDEGYKYGSSWLKEEVPDDVLEWLFTLPGVGAAYSDIRLPEISDDEFTKILQLSKC